MFLLKTFENFDLIYSKNLKYHLDNNISVVDNIFRPYSKEHLALLSEVRILFDRGRIGLKESDRRIFKNTDIGRFVKIKNAMIPLDLPLENNNVQLIENEKKYVVYVKNILTNKVKKIKFNDKKSKISSNDKNKAIYWAQRLSKYFTSKVIKDY